MKDTFYFSHDYNTRTDEKIKLLIRKHQMSGYGIFWAIIEDLYNNANALRLDYEGISFDLHTDEKTVKSIIEDFELFVIKDGFFGSFSVEKRLDERNEKSKKAQASAHKRWGNDANALRPKSDSNAIKERKGKEKKGKKNTNPTLEEFIEYFIKNDYPETLACKVYKYYSEADWYDSKGNKVKSWKQKVQGVWFKDENKVSQTVVVNLAKMSTQEQLKASQDYINKTS
jgi:uncharacterized protein DUF4373